MRVALLACVALVLMGGCSSAAEEPVRQAAPGWLDQIYDDGTVRIRYPRGWIQNTTDLFGHVVSDNKSVTAAFVGIRYLPKRTWADATEFAEVARRTLRPPDGALTRVVYVQAARIGGRKGFEVSIVWRLGTDASSGPRMRVFGIELASGRVALLTFAAEDIERHAIAFGWIKRQIRWR
jgi:hypothetical protein